MTPTDPRDLMKIDQLEQGDYAAASLFLENNGNQKGRLRSIRRSVIAAIEQREIEGWFS